MLWLLLIGLVVFGWFYIHKHFKFPKVGSLVCSTGPVKSGKSTFSFALAYKTYKRNLRAVKIRNWFNRLFKREEEELPLFYTTIPVAVPHVLLTRQLLERKERFAYKSVIWVDEASLLIDNSIYKEVELADQIMLFNKLIAHETKGGTLVYNTQAIGDLAIGARRCLSTIFHVHSTVKWIPFFLVVTLREERYSEDGTIVNSYENDVEESLKRVIIPKSVWNKFDCYCYSSMTDSLPINKNVVETTDLKAKKIISFNPRHNVVLDEKRGLKREKTNN